jgi:hypothetical protein
VNASNPRGRHRYPKIRDVGVLAVFLAGDPRIPWTEAAHHALLALGWYTSSGRGIVNDPKAAKTLEPVTLRDLYAAARCGDRTIRRGLRQLVACGLVTVVRGKRHEVNVYRLNEKALRDVGNGQFRVVPQRRLNAFKSGPTTSSEWSHNLGSTKGVTTGKERGGGAQPQTPPPPILSHQSQAGKNRNGRKAPGPVEVPEAVRPVVAAWSSTFEREKGCKPGEPKPWDIEAADRMVETHGPERTIEMIQRGLRRGTRDMIDRNRWGLEAIADNWTELAARQAGEPRDVTNAEMPPCSMCGAPYGTPKHRCCQRCGARDWIEVHRCPPGYRTRKPKPQTPEATTHV